MHLMSYQISYAHPCCNEPLVTDLSFWTYFCIEFCIFVTVSAVIEFGSCEGEMIHSLILIFYRQILKTLKSFVDVLKIPEELPPFCVFQNIYEYFGGSSVYMSL